MSNLTKYLFYPTLAIVIGGIALQYLTHTDILGICISGIKSVISFCSHPIPLWTILMPVVLLAFYYRHKLKNYTLPPDNYTSDKIFAITWEWDSYRTVVPENDLIPLCPNCKCELDHSTTPYRELFISCQNCNFHKSFDNMTFQELLEKTNKEIDRRIRLKRP
jgi:hypothetical protein